MLSQETLSNETEPNTPQIRKSRTGINQWADRRKRLLNNRLWKR
jgi:hypothetical protein